MDTVNKNLSHPKRLEYPSNINLVEKVIDVFAEIELTREINYILYEEAFIVADKILGDYSNKRGFLDDLIQRSIF